MEGNIKKNYWKRKKKKKYIYIYIYIYILIYNNDSIIKTLN